MALTKKQKGVFDYIEAHIRTQGFAPTMREICKHFGWSSAATAHKYLHNLIGKGVLQHEVGRARSLELPAGDLREHARAVPLFGLVAAGTPIEALSGNETMSLPEDLLGRGETFVLKVKGDSMVEDHIVDGDFIIVEKRDHADNGDIVVALIDNEATVKRIYREAGRVRLQPSHPTLPPIYVEEERLRIQGIVTGILRKMSRR